MVYDEDETEDTEVVIEYIENILREIFLENVELLVGDDQTSESYDPRIFDEADNRPVPPDGDGLACFLSHVATQELETILKPALASLWERGSKTLDPSDVLFGIGVSGKQVVVPRTEPKK